MKQNISQVQKINLTGIDRIVMFTFHFTQYLLFLYFGIKMVHYIGLPMPTIFLSPSLLSSPFKQPQYVYNGFLYLLFFVQHVAMALIGFKIKLANSWNKYPLYERYVFNLTSQIVYITILSKVRPVSDLSTQVFRTPQMINNIFIVIGLVLLAISFVLLGSQIFNAYSLKEILFAKKIQFKGYKQTNIKGLINTGVYGIIRHPMQSSFVILFLFASNSYTVDRLVFILFNIVGILIGVYNEEKGLRFKMDGYKEYQNTVKYRFIPYLY